MDDELATFLEGDCVTVMAAMPDASVDAVVTDPPYGLEFMGKEWDRLAPTNGRESLRPDAESTAPVKSSFKDGVGTRMGAPKKNPRCHRCHRLKFDHEPRRCACVEPDWDTRTAEYARVMQDWHTRWATEAYRLLKPGGYLLAFGGTRTVHRLASAIEDAGFEIRDCLVWAYASGFPKSLDVSKAMDRQRDDYADVCTVALWLRPHVERIGFDVVTREFGFADETMARARWTSKSQPQVPSWEQWERLKTLLGFGDEMDAEVWRLNGRKGTPGEAWDQRQKVGERDVPDARVAPPQFYAMGSDDGQSAPSRTVDVTAPATDAAKRWQGWGTALKPAWEPIVMARKPLIGTVAANVTAHGTGALNIDGTRIPGAPRNPGFVEPSSDGLFGGADNGNLVGYESPSGRWPANLILTDPLFDGGVDGVVGGGTGGGGFGVRGRTDGSLYEGGWDGTGQAVGYGDTGTYSRFFQLPGGRGCYLCGRANPAVVSFNQRSLSGDSAPDPAPTVALSDVDTMTYPPPTSGTEQLFWRVDERNTPSTPRSKRRGTSPASTPPSSPAKSTDATDQEIATTTTTGDRWMCATCAEAITSDTTSVWQPAPNYSRFLLIPKADRADREPVLRGQLAEGQPRHAYGDGLNSATKVRTDEQAVNGVSRQQRENLHPTVKPVELMRHLVRLVTPPGGTVLDPFLGSGSTAIAANMEGFRCIGIEREADYLEIARARMAHQKIGMGL